MPRDDLKDKILAEINKTGFPLELRVSKLLHGNGYHVANNLYYIDRDDNKGREVDIRALKNTVFEVEEISYFVRHCLLIECKRSTSKPWVIFTSPQTSYDHELHEVDCRGLASADAWISDDLLDALERIHPFAALERRGRSYFEPFKSTETGEAIFKSLTTAVKATVTTRDGGFAAGGKQSICFYYPLVVFDGRLFEAHLGDNDDIAITEAGTIMVSFFYDSPSYKQEKFTVPIVTEGYLDDFLSKLDSVLQIFGDSAAKNIGWFGK
jgi:hypothetical protein